MIAIAGGILLLAGLWTPVTGTFGSLDEAWVAFCLGPSQMVLMSVHLFLAVLALSISMLGPGAWSVDARLFGRKRIDIDRIGGRKPSLYDERLKKTARLDQDRSREALAAEKAAESGQKKDIRSPSGLRIEIFIGSRITGMSTQKGDWK